MRQTLFGWTTLLLASALACSPGPERPHGVLTAGGPYKTILLSQAQFDYVTKNGKKLPQPGPALLVIKQKTAQGWQDTVLEDPQSNVFHKALIFGEDGAARRILTISGMAAALKLWDVAHKSPQATVLWNPVFGGTWNRVRDVEVGDVTGDGVPEIVMATHDQGVVAVARKTAQGWAVEEIDREPDIFVHEVEIGDVDGDRVNEFFVTPSKPNKARGGPQPGSVVMYKWNGAGFAKTVVDSCDRTHAKEILACDIDGTGVATLFSVFEAETGSAGHAGVRAQPVKIKKYAFQNGTVTGEVIATLDDLQCRFLTAGELDGDGRPELVAAAMKSGLWLLKKNGAGWTASLIDARSSGYEHAACIADLDEDGRGEIYVAADDQRQLCSYVWNGTAFTKTVLAEIPDNRITWNITAGTL